MNTNKHKDEVIKELVKACKFALGQLEYSKPQSAIHSVSLAADIKIIKSAILKAEGKI